MGRAEDELTRYCGRLCPTNSSVEGRARASHPDGLPGYDSGQHGAPLGPDEEEKRVSEYVAALQGGGGCGGCEGLQRAALHQNMTTTVKFRGENTKLESWYGFTT